MKKVFLTYHAVERIQERFPLFCDNFTVLKNWKKKASLDDLYPIFNELLAKSKENNSFLNNTTYMIHLYETYGYDVEYKMMEIPNEAIVLVLAKKRSENHFRIVTIVPDRFIPKSISTKYSDKKKKSEIKIQKVLDFHYDYEDSIKTFIQQENLEFDDIKSEDEMLSILIENGQHKKINDELNFVKMKDSLYTFSMGLDIKNVNKYDLFSKQQVDINFKKNFLNDYLNGSEKIKEFFKISNKCIVFKYQKNTEHLVVFMKSNRDIENKVKLFNKELLPILNLENENQ